MLKAARRFALCALCFMMMVNGQAAAESLMTKSVKAHTVEFGSQTSYILYEEPGIMQEEGYMIGVVGAYTFRDWLVRESGNGMFRADGRLSYGQVDYEGQLSDDTPYNISDIDDYLFEMRGLVGYDVAVQENTTLTPYVGAGYRYLNDDASFDPAGYEREANYFYSPIGLEYFYRMEGDWSVGFVVEYDLFWRGWQESHLSDAVPSLSDLENDQKDGYGLRGSIKFEKEAYNMDVCIEPYIIYWDIDESEETPVTLSGTIIGTGVEPENDSLEIGLKLALKF